jgi:hypothetical protein
MTMPDGTMPLGAVPIHRCGGNKYVPLDVLIETDALLTTLANELKTLLSTDYPTPVRDKAVGMLSLMAHVKAGN